MPAPLRLRLDGNALTSNWRWLAGRSGGAACGAAVKADGYGLGARQVVAHLAAAGCRDFFVATWAEAVALGPLPDGRALSVLHGVRAEDMGVAVASTARPVLNTAEQVARWRPTGRPCDVMIDTGMNRLGLSSADDLAGLEIDTLMSHLACADEDSPMNAAQRAAFAALDVPAKRRSLANSAGICLGGEYAFDLTRPGLALYGGLPRADATGHIAQVVFPEAQIVQRRCVPAGQGVGYGATFVAARDTDVAILNIGYADGYLRSFSSRGSAGQRRFPVLGRVSMDLTAIDVTGADIGEGDWVVLDYDLPTASAASGLSQYELLTGLASRFERIWS
ncbi:alanine racemase [Sphingomonas sp. SUN039]|uniref:alanine racemase n=1 Tax=Sphingomonas sp. SUN039 TaxID=2937787 RepID=UPI002164C6AA|nr:alanine racemase [Sphingomonas sp. SUN039]UVO54072.1 alanine racemase [Sphingomonas sp. SUN039]